MNPVKKMPVGQRQMSLVIVQNVDVDDKVEAGSSSAVESYAIHDALCSLSSDIKNMIDNLN